MPTRFPLGLNQYKGEDSLNMLPTPWPNLSGWAVWHEDFEKYAGWTSILDSTGTVGLGSSVVNASRASMGAIELVTANTDGDKVTIFPTPRVANTLANQFPGSIVATGEMVFATQFTLGTLLDQGVAIGAATGGTINSVGTAGNMTTASPTNGLYVRKPVTAAGNLELVLKRSTEQTITLVAAASVVALTNYKVVAHIKNGQLRASVNNVWVGSALTATAFTTSVAAFIQAVQSGTGGAQTLNVDYLYFAWKAASATQVR
jgi:hypothetical protein